MLNQRMGSEDARTEPDRIIRTVCSPNCSGTCGINAFVKDDQIVKVEPADFPDKNYNRICLKGIAMAMQRNRHARRIHSPIRRIGKRGEGRWETITWEEAYEFLANKLGEISEEYGAESAAWISMTGNYGIRSISAANRVANSLGGTFFTNLGIMGDSGCNMGYLTTMGVHSVAHDWCDLRGSELVLMLGKNAADTAHSDIHFLFDAMESGTEVIVVDPRFSRTATKADQWVSVRPGTDSALILCMVNTIINRGLHDETYIRSHTNAPYLVRDDNGKLLRFSDFNTGGDDSYVVLEPDTYSAVPRSASSLPLLEGSCNLTLVNGETITCHTAFSQMLKVWQSYTPSRTAQICEIPEQVIVDLALKYASKKTAAVWLGQGMQRYHHGHLAIRAAITLGAVCGNIGKAHAGVSWADGPLFRMLFSMSDEWLQPGGRKGRVLPGTRIHDIIASQEPYPIKSLWTVSYGFGTQSPNFRSFVDQCLPKLDLFVVTEQVMTEAALYADLVLPCVTYYEDDMDLVGGGENPYVQLRRRAVPPYGLAKNDWDIFKNLCARMGREEGWQMTDEEACQHYLSTANDPYIREIDWNTLHRDGVVRLNIPEPYVPFENLDFPTPSGKLEIYSEQLCDYDEEIPVFKEPLEGKYSDKAAKYPLCMITNHQMHTVHSQHTILPWIREQLPGPVLDMNPRDAEARQIKEGDMVRVFNDRGEFKVHVGITEGIKQGVVNLPQGWWPDDFPEKSHYANLNHLQQNPAQNAILETNFAAFDSLVEVTKA